MAMGKLNILVAHSDKNVKSVLQEKIYENMANCEIYFADDGPQVVRVMEQMRISILFLEMEIPKKSGEGVLEEITRLSVDHRPSLTFLFSAEDYSVLDSSTKKAKIKYIPDFSDFTLINEMIENFRNPKTRSSKASASNKAGMDVTLMNPIVDATLNVLEIMVQLKAEKIGVSLKDANEVLGDISAFYPVISNKFGGFFCISFPKDSYLRTMESMLFGEFTEINDENIDGIGELCNQIVGNAKAHYNEEYGAQLKMASPVIELKGKSKVIKGLKGQKVVIEFKTDCGPFNVEVAMAKK